MVIGMGWTCTFRQIDGFDRGLMALGTVLATLGFTIGCLGAGIGGILMMVLGFIDSQSIG